MYLFFGRHLTTPWGVLTPTLGTTDVWKPDSWPAVNVHEPLVLP